MKKKVYFLLILCLLALVTYGAYNKTHRSGASPDAASAFASGDTLYVWYTDENIKDYMTNMSAAFYEKTGFQVVPVLHSGLEYLQSINTASVKEEDQPAPDVFLLTNDSLGRAYLAGLAREIKNPGNVVSTEHYAQAAIDAVTYNGKLVGYPLFFETSAFLYNKTYIDATEAELPKTIEEILQFADEYDAPEQVESVFRWDVSDIFYNYYFVGSYMDIGGPTGDDETVIRIYNDNTKACLETYQMLNQFFSIDTKEVNYDTVVRDFTDGKIVMTVVTSDIISKLEAAKADGSFEYDYVLTKMPDISEVLKGRSLSVTGTAVINGYSEKAETAEQFAKFLAYDRAEDIGPMAGKLAARKDRGSISGSEQAFLDEYEQSASLPKMPGSENYWVQLEIAFSKIWKGEDVKSLLTELEQTMKLQLG